MTIMSIWIHFADKSMLNFTSKLLDIEGENYIGISNMKNKGNIHLHFELYWIIKIYISLKQIILDSSLPKELVQPSTFRSLYVILTPEKTGGEVFRKDGMFLNEQRYCNPTNFSSCNPTIAHVHMDAETTHVHLCMRLLITHSAVLQFYDEPTQKNSIRHVRHNGWGEKKNKSVRGNVA